MTQDPGTSTSGKRPTKEEYEEEAEKFRDNLNRAASGEPGVVFPEKSGDWLGIDMIATCRNSGCPVEGKSFLVYVHENADGKYRVVCGKCGTYINDLVPQYDEGQPGSRAAFLDGGRT